MLSERMRHVLFIGMALISGCLSAADGTDNTDGTTADGTATADGSATTDGSADTGVEVSALTSAPGPYFATSMFFNRDISTASKSSNSDTIINALKNAGGWGNGNVIQIDFALDVLTATSTTPKRTSVTVHSSVLRQARARTPEGSSPDWFAAATAVIRLTFAADIAVTADIVCPS